jgi:hypothetical protein
MKLTIFDLCTWFNHMSMYSALWPTGPHPKSRDRRPIGSLEIEAPSLSLAICDFDLCEAVPSFIKLVVGWVDH